MTHFIWVKFDDSCQFWHYFAIGLFRVSTITWMSCIHFGIWNTSSLENGWTWNFKLGHQVKWAPSSGRGLKSPIEDDLGDFNIGSNLILHHRIVNENSFPVSKNAEITFSVIVILQYFRSDTDVITKMKWSHAVITNCDKAKCRCLLSKISFRQRVPYQTQNPDLNH